MSVAVGIQARVSSTRLPGKVLMDLGGKPMIERVWDACWGPFDRVILTSKDPTDDDFCRCMKAHNIAHRRGSLANVLSRYTALAKEKRPDVLVRVCGDAPFLDRRWIFKAVDLAEAGPVFVPGALHAGRVEDWLDCEEQCDEEDKEHAGAYWFEDRGVILDLVPKDYRSINTMEDMIWARQQWEKQ